MSLKVTVIIPHRVGENIENTLAGIYMSDYPKNDIEIFQAEGTHPTVQRNECIKKASGDIVYFIDNDSMVNPNNIKKAVEIFEKNENVAIVGGPAIHKTSSSKEKYIDKCMRSYYAVGPIANRYSVNKISSREGTDRDVILCNLFIRLNVLFEAGLFNESLYPNEENALIDKILSLGYKLMYDPQIVVKRPTRSSLRLYIKMLLNYGRGRFEQLYIDFNKKNLIFTIPAFFSLYIIFLPIVLFIFLITKIIFLAVYFIPFALYFVMTLLAGIITALKEKGFISKIRAFFIFPYMFFITHFFYGLGFFYGIARIVKGFTHAGGRQRTVKFNIKKYKSFE